MYSSTYNAPGTKICHELLAMQATCVMNRKQEGIHKFFPVVDILGHVNHCARTSRAMLAKEIVGALMYIHLIGFTEDNGMHA